MEDLLLLASKMGDMETHFGEKYENKRRGSKKYIILDISHQTIRTNIFFQQLDVRTKFQYSLSAWHTHFSVQFKFRSKLIHLREEYLQFKGKDFEHLILAAVPTLIPNLVSTVKWYAAHEEKGQKMHKRWSFSLWTTPPCCYMMRKELPASFSQPMLEFQSAVGTLVWAYWNRCGIG